VRLQVKLCRDHTLASVHLAMKNSNTQLAQKECRERKMGKRIQTQSKHEPVSSLIAFCGIDCGECKAYIATKNNDAEMKKAIAEEWSKSFGHQMKPEDINCVSCLVTEGPHIGYCAVCEIRACGTQKKVENCAYCVEYACGKLDTIHSRSSVAKENLEKIHKQTKKRYVE